VKHKFAFSIIILTVLLIILTFNTAAYFKTDNPRPALLDIRDAERALKSAAENIESAEENYRLIDQDNIRIASKELDNKYDELTFHYRNKEDLLVKETAAQLINLADKVKLMALESKPVQLRSFWLDSGTLSKCRNRDGISQLLDNAQKANFNVILAEVFFRGLSIIPNNNYFVQDPRFKDWEEDPLKALIEEAEKRGMEVHAWVWVFNENTLGSPGRILQANPSWANKNKKGEVLTYHNSSWLSPSRIEVRKYLQRRYLYLVENYELAGINLDYIRFPEEYRGSFGYDQHTLDLFKEETGIDAMNIESDSKANSVWNDFRESLITKMVKETSYILKNEDPTIKISADVIPGTEEARYRALQNWKLWLDEGYLDFVFPMTYTNNLFSELNNWVKKDRFKVDKAIYPGISLFKLTRKQILDQIETINEINPNGLSLFAAAHLNEEDYNALAAGYFKDQATIPYTNKEDNLELLRENIVKRIELFYSAGTVNSREKEILKNYLNLSNLNRFEKLKSENEDKSLIIIELIKRDFLEYLNQNNVFLPDKVIEVFLEDINYYYDILRLY